MPMVPQEVPVAADGAADEEDHPPAGTPSDPRPPAMAFLTNTAEYIRSG